MKTTGKIGVTSENIFPVIKKFLYSEHDIFLRELVSNAIDATSKLNALIARGTSVGNTDDLKVEIEVDADKKTISVKDKGIGMTAQEVDQYINQIAFSGAEEFLKKYQDASIIGHFGLGFYSAFMVAKKVEIESLSYQENAEPVHWECDGSPEYSMKKGSRTERGTEIILHLDDDSLEYLQHNKIKEILDKYSKFLPIPIVFGKKQEWKDGKMQDTEEDLIINNTKPLWTLKPSELTPEQYIDFYHELYPGVEEPLFWIHLNVDYPFHLTGILYFPRLQNNMELRKNRIKLFCNQVYVTDEVADIVPEYLTLLHGVLDSPDIPLNVSRSYLQGDPNIAKISGHITKKVAERLEDIFKNNREEYEEKWQYLKLFIQYGLLSDEKFYERASKLALFTDTEGKNYTGEEYRTLIEANQTDQDGQLVFLYASKKAEQYSYIRAAQERGYSVLLMDGVLDTHFMNLLEQKWEKSRFVSVDSDTPDQWIPKEGEATNIETGTQHIISQLFSPSLPQDKDKMFAVEARHVGAQTAPAIITRNEWMRRMKEMSQIQGESSFYGAMPDSYTVVINVAHPLVEKVMQAEKEEVEPTIKQERDQLSAIEAEIAELEKSTDKAESEASEEQQKELEEKRAKQTEIKNQINEKLNQFAQSKPIIKQITDLALLSNGLLQGEELDRFIARSTELLIQEI